MTNVNVDVEEIMRIRSTGKVAPNASPSSKTRARKKKGDSTKREAALAAAAASLSCLKPHKKGTKTAIKTAITVAAVSFNLLLLVFVARMRSDATGMLLGGVAATAMLLVTLKPSWWPACLGLGAAGLAAALWKNVHGDPLLQFVLVYISVVLPLRGLAVARADARHAAVVRTAKGCNVLYTMLVGKLPPPPGFHVDGGYVIAAAPLDEGTIVNGWFDEERASMLFADPRASLLHMSPPVRAYFFGKKEK